MRQYRGAAWLLLLFALPASAAEFRAGVASRRITPDEPIHLSGYAQRTRPSQGIADELHAKALAFDDGRGSRVVVITAEVCALPRSVAEVVAARLMREHNLDRSQILLNVSHTHAGPVVWPALQVMHAFTADEQAVVDRYARRLENDLVAVATAALADLKPARLEFAWTSAPFAMNRRRPGPQGIRLAPNPEGPTDHRVPVLRVTGRDKATRAVLFGYACHNTTLGGDFEQVSGDYAGAAMAAIEKQSPGTTALFLMLCGGDQNPEPRGTLALARQHGQTLATAVLEALRRPMRPVRGRIRSALQMADLAVEPHTRESFTAEPRNPYEARRNALLLRAHDERRAPRTVPYPVQALRFGKDLTVLALGGEVVVGYAQRATREYPKETLVVAGYSNDVMGYIPTAAILREGGYEPVTSVVYYGLPAPFTTDIEETIFATIRSVLGRVIN